MTAQATIESLLEKKIGLSADAIGRDTIIKAIYRRTHDCGLSDIQDYLNFLSKSEKEWEDLIELVVVPETWFFRNKESFAFFARYVRTEWLPENNKDQALRILSIPCSTGEEPYSIAMALMDTDLISAIGRHRIFIEAIDISNKVLQKARLGIYGKESFRGKNLSFRERYFDPIEDPYEWSSQKRYKWQIKPSVRNMIHFKRGNLVDEQILIYEKPYHIIFCRNLLIYLSEMGKKRALYTIEQLLTKEGILFVGHVERPFICGASKSEQFSGIHRPGVFACRRSKIIPPQIDISAGSGAQKEGNGKSFTPDKKSFKKPVPFDRQKPAAQTLADKYRHSTPFGTISHQTVVPVNQVNHNSDETTDIPPSASGNETVLEEARRLADQGELKTALKLCEKYLKENAFHIQAHFLMGLIFHALDDEEHAETYFNKTIYLDPNHYEALSHLAFIMEHRGDQSRAIQLRQRANRILEREVNH